MTTADKVTAAVKQRLGDTVIVTDREEYLVELAVAHTIEVLGLYVDHRTGEVREQVPRDPMASRNARWSGGRRRR